MAKSTPAVTLKALAEAVGCSRAVVSAVINGSKGNIRVSEDLRRRVLEAAERHRYRPHHASQALALGRTMTLGVYIDPLYGGGLAGQYHADILAGIERSAQEARYDVLLVNFAGRTKLSDCIDKIVGTRIDGLLLLHAGRDEKLIGAILEASSNVVAIDCLDPPDTLQAVLYDHQQATDLALDHLTALGHRRVGYAGPFSRRPIPHNLARVEALRGSCRQRRLSLPDSWVVYRDLVDGSATGTAQAAEQIVEQFLSLPPRRRPTALLVYNDHLAVGLLRALTARGLSVPGDLSLINFEDTHLCRATTPCLTCLDHPVYEMSRHATRRLVRTIEGSPDPDSPSDSDSAPWHRLYPATLIPRDSTGPVPSL